MNTAPSSARPGVHASAVLVALAALLLVHRRTFGQFFFLEDCQLILLARDTSWGELFARHFLRPYWDQDQLFWRPGWSALFKLAHGAFGSDPRGYMALGVGLQGLLVVLVYGTAARATGSVVAALAAALLYVTTPASAEAVVWPSASLNVLPAALCVAGAGLALGRWLEGGEAEQECRLRHSDQARGIGAGARPRAPRGFLTLGGRASYAALLALFGASFLFREAAYHLVPLYPAAVWILCGPQALRSRRALAGFVPLVAGVLAHFVFLNTTWIGGGSGGYLEGLPESLRANAALFAPLGLPAALGFVLVPALALAAWIFATPRTRFFLAWAACAFFPYLLIGPASRFTVFPAVPLALGLALLGHDLVQRARAPALRMALPAAALALVSAQVPVLETRLAEYRARGELYRHVLAWGLENLRGLERVHLVLRHPSQAGLAQMLSLHFPAGPQVAELWAVRKGPFVLYDGELPDGAPGSVAVRVDVRTGDCRVIPPEELVPAGTTAVPSAEFRHAWRLARPGEEPGEGANDGELVLARDPGLALEPSDAGRNRVLYRQFHPLGVAYKLRCETNALFVVRSFWARTDLVLEEVRVDGRAVEPIPADGLFLAIPLPTGTRTLALRGRKSE